MKIDPIENWLDTVAFNHSNSQQTRRIYKAYFQKFLNHAQTTAENILQDYNTSITEREFRQKYTPIIMSLIGEMNKQNLSQSTQHSRISTVKSFFKYNSLPLGYIPSGRQFIEFHNRDIEKEEIEEIIKDAQPREKAYYTLMAQSGLRPQTVSKLTIGDLEKLLDENTPIPCLIKIPQNKTKGQYSEYFTFTGKESIAYIKEYLKRERSQPLTQENYLFTMKDGRSPVRPDVINHTFKRTVEKLKAKNVLNFKTNKKDMPNEKRKSVSRNELRLYNLRKYFRNNAHAGWDYVNFWMGHIAKLGSDKHYFSQTNIDQHRQQYKEKAMPHLNIETTTPDEIAPIITDLQNKLTQQQKDIERRDNELQELKNTVENLRFQVEIDAQVTWKRNINDMTIPPEEARKRRLLTPEALRIIKTEEQKTTKPYTQRLTELHLRNLEETLENIKKSTIKNKELHSEDLERQIELTRIALGQYPKTEKAREFITKFLMKEITTKDFQNMINSSETKKQT